MKVTYILPILFQGFYANSLASRTSACSESITGIMRIMTEMSHEFESRGYCEEAAEFENLIGTDEKLMICGSFPEKKIIELEKALQNGWDMIKAYGILDLEETKNYVFEVQKAVETFSRFGHGNLHVDHRLREAFGIVFGNSADIQTRVETVYKGFKTWQTRWSDDESAEMLQVLFSAIIDELKPLAKSYGDFVEAVVQIVKSRTSRQRRSIIANQAAAFLQDNILEFIGDMSYMTQKQRLTWLDADLKAKLREIGNTNMRFEDISKNIEISVANVIDIWNINSPMIITHLEKFQFENVLNYVQQVIVSPQFEDLLEAVLEFPRAIWEEFDIDEFVQLNKFVFAEIYENLNDFIVTSASNSQTLMIEEHDLPLVY